jgi:hypothetical protein
MCYNLYYFVLHEEFASMKSTSKSRQGRTSRLNASSSTKLREVMTIAEREGLLAGERTQVIRGRMPRALVARAKNRTGIASDTDLIEVALAHIAVADDYADWLLSKRGAVTPEVDLEF